MGCIYRLTAPSGFSYIGKTKFKFKTRLNGHLNETYSKESKLPIHNAIRKYTIDSFQKEIIVESEDEELLLLIESEFVAKERPLGKLYNLTDGGLGVVGYIMSEENVQKLRISTKELWKSPEFREKVLSKVSGEKHHAAKLTNAQVLEIKVLLSKGLSYEDIGNQFEIHPNRIKAIWNEKCWKSILWPIGFVPTSRNWGSEYSEQRRQQTSIKHRGATSKFTADDVRTIREMRKGGVANKTVAFQFGVTPSAISAINNRKNFGWVE